jgi:hypothetical protein
VGSGQWAVGGGQFEGVDDGLPLLFAVVYLNISGSTWNATARDSAFFRSHPDALIGPPSSVAGRTLAY